MLKYIKRLTCFSVFIIVTLINTRYADAKTFAYDDFVYTVHYGDYEWSRARVVCLREGGDLIEIKDAATQNEVRVALGSKGIEADGFWIGAMRLQTKIANTWLWTSGDEVEYYNWYNSSQETQQGECVMMRASDFKWRNYPCYNALYQFSFICSNSTTNASLEPYISSVTPNTNATVFYPGQYFEIDVEITIPTSTSFPLICIQMITWLTDYYPVYLYLLLSSLEMGKNIEITYYHESIHAAVFCCLFRLKNRDGEVENNFIRFRYGVLVVYGKDSVIRLSARITFPESRQHTVHFPLTFNYIFKNAPISKVPSLKIQPASSASTNRVKGKTLIFSINAYIPYLYPSAIAKVSSRHANNSSGLGIAWIKLDRVGWNYEENLWDGIETVADCYLRKSLSLRVGMIANRGLYLSPNTTEDDLLRFKVCVYFTEQPSEALTYPLNIQISYQLSAGHYPDVLERTIGITTTNISEHDNAEMDVNLSLESSIEKDVNSSNTTMTIMVETIQNTVYSYHILLFMDIKTPIDTVQFDNVTVTNRQRNLVCVRVNMFAIELREKAVEAKRRELAVIQINASNVYNVSDDENTVTVTMLVNTEPQNTQIRVAFITLETYVTLISNTSTSLDVSDESCDSQSNIIQTNIFLILVVCLVQYQFTIP